LHCSDLHLDKSFNIPNLARVLQRKEDLNNNFSSIVDYAIQNRPDLFLVTGDVFDKISPTNSARVFLTQKMRNLKDAGIPVFIVGGNHDVPKVGQSPYLAIDVLDSAGLANVFSQSDIIQKQMTKIDGKRVCISGKSYFSQFECANPLKGFDIPLEGDYNILMLHGSLQGLNVVSSIPEMASQNPFMTDDIKKGIDYLALGHFHNHFERNYRDCLIVNPGSIEKLSWAEINDSKGFAWVELKASDASVEFIDLKTRPMERINLALSKATEYDPSIKEYVVKHLSKMADPEKMLKLILHGLISQEQYGQLKVNEILQACRDMFFHLDLERKELDVEGYGRIFAERVENPIVAFTKRLDTMIEATSQDEKKRNLLEQVKQLGINYLGTAR